MIAQIDKRMLRSEKRRVLARLACWALIEGRPLTTRGRWINPLVFLLYRIVQTLPIHKGAEDPIFIVGTGRSGTTILGKLFAMHGEAVFLNEPKAAWHYAYPLEDVIGSYSNGEASFMLDETIASPTISRKIKSIYSLALRLANSSRVVDKYPELVFRTKFVRRLFPKCVFLSIVRDGVDTCSSVVEWSRRKGVQTNGERHDWWGRDDRKWRLLVKEVVPLHEDLAPYAFELSKATDHHDRAAVEWILSMRAAQVAESEIGNDFHIIRYEELCAKPVEVMQEMQLLCSLPNDENFIEYGCSIMEAREEYDSIFLAPYLVEPFKMTLIQMGYTGSVARVNERQLG